MALILIAGPTSEPVTLAEAKAHCRIDIDDDDALVEALVAAAREYVELLCRPQVAMISQTWRKISDLYPSRVIELRPYPLQTVVAITVTGEDGGETVVSSGDYLVDTLSEPGRLALRSAASWPAVALQELNGFAIEFVAGFGDDAADVPQQMRQAMLLLIGHWYENREPQITTGGVPASLDFTVQALLRPWRREV